MSNIHYIVLIVALWAIYLIFIFLWKKWIKEKKNAWKLELTGRIEERKVVQKAISDLNNETAKKDKLERDLKAWKRLGTCNK